MKKLLCVFALTLPLFIYSQELDKTGYKFVEKAFNAFIDGNKEKLSELYFTLERHNEYLATQDITEISQDVHDKKVKRLMERSIENRNEMGDFDWSKVDLEKVNTIESSDVEGLMFFNLNAIGTDGSKSYTVYIEKCIQFYNGKYYLSNDLTLTIK